MRRYVVSRIASLVLVLVGVSVLLFVIEHLTPGDPAVVILTRTLGQPPSRDEIQAERHALRLDRPLPTQYVLWLERALHGDLGSSWQTGTSVTSAMARRVPYTAELAAAAAALAIAIGIPVGVLTAWRRNSIWDHLSRGASLFGASFPSYFVAYALIAFFGVSLGLLPVFGAGSAAHLVLPAVTLAIAPAATLMRLTRSAMLETLSEEHIRTAWGKGLAPRAVLFRHALRCSMNAIVTVLALMSAQLLAGSVIVESIFAWPGLGTELLDAIHARDFPTVQGCVLLIAICYVTLNFLCDLTYAWVDPRVRLWDAEVAR